MRRPQESEVRTIDVPWRRPLRSVCRLALRADHQIANRMPLHPTSGTSYQWHSDWHARSASVRGLQAIALKALIYFGKQDRRQCRELTSIEI